MERLALPVCTMPFKPKMKFAASTVQDFKKGFGLFPASIVVSSKAIFEKHFKVYREEMRGRSTYGPLFKNSGRLGGSYDREVSGGTLTQLRASVFSRSTYSVVHEQGGTVYPPVGSTWIYIPTVYNALYTIRAHVRRPKRSVRQVRSEGGRFISTKDFVRTFPNARKTLSAMDFVSKSLLINAEGIPMFTLWKRARYKAVLEFFKSGEKYEQFIITDIADAQTEYWKDA